MSQIDFKGKTTTELKAIAYDILATIQQYQQVLNNINNEIAERNVKESQNKTEPVKEEKSPE